MSKSDIATRWFPNSMPPPMVDHHTLPWWEACTEHKLTAQRCKACSHAQHPPAPICSECHTEEFDMVELSGKGSLYTFTVVHQAVSPEQSLPFVIAVVDLDMDGADCSNTVRIMSNVVDCDPDTLQIGQPLEVVWETMSEFVSIPRFKITA